jgi:Rrf2 family iron-sulfur cluster assembly transcriptional regulator
LLSKTAEYALRATVFLARHREEGWARAADMARDTGVPANYLSKILHQLARQGIVRSERGRHGGFALAYEPGDLTLAHIISVFGSVSRTEGCILGRRQCSPDAPCGAHDSWMAVKIHVAQFFETTTVEDVSAGAADLPWESGSGPPI